MANSSEYAEEGGDARAVIPMTPMHWLVTMSLAPLLLLGCIEPQSDSVPDPFLTEFSTDTLLAHDLQGELFVHSDLLGNPTRIAVGELFVFVGDPDGEQAITVFDRSSLDAQVTKEKVPEKYHLCGHWTLSQGKTLGGFTIIQGSSNFLMVHP